MISELDEKIIDTFSWIPFSYHTVSSGPTLNSLIPRRMSLFLHYYLYKTLIFWKTRCSFLKTLKIWYLRLPRRGQDFWNLACFAWSPIVAPWSAHDRPVIIWSKWKDVLVKCFRFFKNPKNVKNKCKNMYWENVRRHVEFMCFSHFSIN